MSYYAVIDTNIVVSSMLRRLSIPGKIIDYVISGKIIPLLNEEIVEEYIEVLSRDEFGFSKADINDLILFFREKGIFLERTTAIEKFIDQDDAVFFEIVTTARKTTEAYLVTGNTKHFPIKHFVVTPGEMLEIIDK